MKIRNYILNHKMIDEGSHEGAVAWDDLTKFYQVANKEQKDKMVDLVKNNNWDGFKLLIYKVIGKKMK